jgi:hypothetical protein
MADTLTFTPLTDDDIYAHIDERYKEQVWMGERFRESARKLKRTVLEQLSIHPILFELCHIPVILDIVPQQHNRIDDMGRKPNVHFVKMIVNSLLVKYLYDTKRVSDSMLYDLTDTRAEHMCTVDLMFLEHCALAELLHVESQKTLDYMGSCDWLTMQSHMGLLTGTPDQFTFVHRHFRNYFVARFVVTWKQGTSDHACHRLLACLGCDSMTVDEFVTTYVTDPIILLYMKDLNN